MSPISKPVFWEFFAGGGMARAGLGEAWRCAFANDFDRKKAAVYRRNWGDGEMLQADVGALTPDDLPNVAPDLVWGSFPCQDLSLAGNGAGLKGGRSGSFWPFWRLLLSCGEAGRRPAVIALENVCGALSAHGGRDFAAIAEAFDQAGYRFGALVIDAELFLPQSRPRLFLIGAHRSLALPETTCGHEPDVRWTTPALARAVAGLSPELQRRIVWWRLPPPAPRRARLCDLLERSPNDAPWRSRDETQRLIDLMAPLHRRRLEAAKAGGGVEAGAFFRRTRPAPDGGRRQRLEIRFDGVAGCLRTPAGGSSRQGLMIVENGVVRSRLLSARESARLMGLPDSYLLPAGPTDALHLTGDGVAVDVVRHLSEHLLLPLIRNAKDGRAAA